MGKADHHPLEGRLGYSFKTPDLLARALTHGSVGQGKPRATTYQRLEFLGDRVLGLLVAETLWREFPELNEGDLAPRLNALVRKETCAEAARAIDLGAHIIMAPSEERTGGRNKTAILGDACEALFGALYLDGGAEAARKLFDIFWTPNFARLMMERRDAKSALQEWTQAKGAPPPRYEVVSRHGPDHAPVFEVEVTPKGFAPARGEAASKRAAEQAASRAFLLREGVWGGDERAE